MEINEGKDLAIGDDVMYIVVAGDVRETVLSVLTDTLNQIKPTVTSKTEYFVQGNDKKQVLNPEILTPPMLAVPG